MAGNSWLQMLRVSLSRVSLLHTPQPPIYLESKKYRPSLSQTPDISLVYKPLFGEGCLWSCPQLLCCMKAEFLKQPSLSQERSIDSLLPMLVW